MRFSLQAKLILVMTVVVAAATFATSLVTQDYVRRFYERKYEDDFKAEIQFFSERQMQRQKKLRQTCQKLGHSDEMAKALMDKKSEAYKLVREELIDFFDKEIAPELRLRPGGEDSFRKLPPVKGVAEKFFGKPRPSDNGKGPPLPQGQISQLIPTVDIVDADGELLSGGDSRQPLYPKPRGQGRKGESMRSLLKQLDSRLDEEQEIAYRMTDGPDGKPHVKEYIITPVISPDTKEPVGAIFVGVQVQDLGERSLHAFTSATSDADTHSEREASAASSGFWLGDSDKPILLTQTIPPDAREAVSKLVGERIADGHDGSKFAGADLEVSIDGKSEPFRVLHRVLNPGSPFPAAAQVCVYSRRPLLEEESQLRQRIWGIGGASLLGAMLVILVLTHGMVKPIRALVEGTDQIRQGNYDVTVSVSSRDEIGTLAESFNEMAEGLRMNQKYQRLLSQVADRMVAEQLMNNEAALGGELREVSVLFCDIRGFTTLTEGMPPVEVIALLNEHMSALTALVHEHCGVVDKFVGDMIMALFGAPSAYGDDVQRAALCALRMVECRERLNANGRWDFHVGIGIATGTVVAGCMGSEERLDYTVLGERVNLASRLCSVASEGEILIDKTTADKLGTGASVQAVTDLVLKGFSESVEAYQLQSFEPASVPDLEVASKESKFEAA